MRPLSCWQPWRLSPPSAARRDADGPGCAAASALHGACNELLFSLRGAVCIEDKAREFDQRVMDAAMTKLGLDDDERNERTATLLQRKLRDGGGWGLTPAACTSPAAFLGSLAACHAEPTFAPYCHTSPLPPSSQLHAWVDDSLQRVRQAAPGDTYQADIEPLLPVRADDFFSHYSSAASSATSTLQRSLNAKANSHTIEAAVRHTKEQSRQGDRWEWARHKAVTAHGAWAWKAARPEEVQQRLSDVEYAIAARLNLGLNPFPARAMNALPEHCPLCTHRFTGKPVSLRDDPWHWLTCLSMTKGEVSRRHDAVADAIARVAWLVGAQVRREVEWLDPHSKRRPDIQLVFPGRMILSDVVVSHSLASRWVSRNGSSATEAQNRKNAKYAGVASRLGAELMNASVDTCGGLASDTSRLVAAIGEEGERWSMERGVGAPLNGGCSGGSTCRAAWQRVDDAGRVHEGDECPCRA